MKNENDKIIKFETQINGISENLVRFIDVLDRNTETLNKYGKNLTEIFVVQKTMCKEISGLKKETSKSIKEHSTKIQDHSTNIAVLEEKFRQFKRLGISASVILGCISVYKVLYSIFPV